MKKPMLVLAIVLSGMLVQAQSAGFNNSFHDGQLLEEGPGIINSYSHLELLIRNQHRKAQFIKLCDTHTKEQLDSFEIEVFNDHKQWELDLQHQYAYDAEGNVTQYIKNSWDTHLAIWVPNYKYQYTYDDQQKLLSSVYNNWCDSSNKWMCLSKCDYGYDEDNNIITETDSYMNSCSNQWTCNCQFEYTFDVKGKLCMSVGRLFDAGLDQWVNVCKKEFHYKYGSLATILSFDWSGEYQQWKYNFMENYGYNADSNLILYLTYYWDPEIDQWLYSSKKELTYDENENQQTITAFFQDRDKHVWVNSCRKEYTYDEMGNQTMLIMYDWDYADERWVYNWKAEHRYDVNMNIDSLLVHPEAFDIDVHFQHGKLTGWSEQMWDEASGHWVDYRRGNLYFSRFTGIEEEHVLAKPHPGIFPNPAVDLITVFTGEGDFKGELIISDMSGRLLLKEQISGDTKVPLWYYRRGTYVILLLEDNRITYSEKLIIQ